MCMNSVMPAKTEIQTLEYHSITFSCHSRERGNPDLKIQIPCQARNDRRVTRYDRNVDTE